MEKVYKSMRNAGVCGMVFGIVILSTGVIVGVLSIINGALLLKKKSEIVF